VPLSPLQYIYIYIYIYLNLTHTLSRASAYPHLRTTDPGDTHPGVAEAHADGRVDGNTVVALGLLHVQGEVGRNAHGNGRAEQNQQQPAGEHCGLHVQRCRVWDLQWGRRTKSQTGSQIPRRMNSLVVFNITCWPLHVRVTCSRKHPWARCCSESDRQPLRTVFMPTGYNPPASEVAVIFHLWRTCRTESEVHYADDMNKWFPPGTKSVQ